MAPQGAVLRPGRRAARGGRRGGIRATPPCRLERLASLSTACHLCHLLRSSPGARRDAPIRRDAPSHVHARRPIPTGRPWRHNVSRKTRRARTQWRRGGSSTPDNRQSHPRHNYRHPDMRHKKNNAPTMQYNPRPVMARHEQDAPQARGISCSLFPPRMRMPLSALSLLPSPTSQPQTQNAFGGIHHRPQEWRNT